MATLEQINTLQTRLVASGWPGRGTRIEEQHLAALVPPALVQRFAPEEHQIFLFPPPFVTVADDARRNPVYWRTYGALEQLQHPKDAVLIADFGIGSETLIVVDLHTDPARVLRLVWGSDVSRWVEIAPSVETFLPLLGFAPA